VLDGPAAHRWHVKAVSAVRASRLANTSCVHPSGHARHGGHDPGRAQGTWGGELGPPPAARARVSSDAWSRTLASMLGRAIEHAWHGGTDRVAHVRGETSRAHPADRVNARRVTASSYSHREQRRAPLPRNLNLGSRAFWNLDAVRAGGARGDGGGCRLVVGHLSGLTKGRPPARTLASPFAPGFTPLTKTNQSSRRRRGALTPMLTAL
jgi:hypothetical protein